MYILQPLGMDHTTFTLCEAATFSLAVPHRAGPEVLHYIPVNATRHAVGGLFSTVDDMAKLARLLLNDGAPLISPLPCGNDDASDKSVSELSE